MLIFVFSVRVGAVTAAQTKSTCPAAAATQPQLPSPEKVKPPDSEQHHHHHRCQAETKSTYPHAAATPPLPSPEKITCVQHFYL